MKLSFCENHFCNFLLYVLINFNYVNSYHVNLNVCYDMYITRILMVYKVNNDYTYTCTSKCSMCTWLKAMHLCLSLWIDLSPVLHNIMIDPVHYNNVF